MKTATHRLWTRAYTLARLFSHQDGLYHGERRHETACADEGIPTELQRSAWWIAVCQY